MLKLSIIIPLFNTEDYISETLDSIISQKPDNIEVIVVDDASSDNGPKLVDQYNKKYPYIKLIKNKQIKGVSGARNTGIKTAKGKYIAFLDSDDLLLRDSLTQKINLLDQHKQINLISSDFIKFKTPKDLKTNKGFFLNKPEINDALKPYKKSNNIYIIDDTMHFYINHVCLIWCGTIVIRRKHLNKVGFFDENLTHGEDMELWCRLSLNEKLLFISQPLSGYRVRKNSAVTDQYKLHQGTYRYRKQLLNNPDFKAYKPELKHWLLEETLSFIYYCRENSLWKKGVKLSIYSLKIKPFSLNSLKQIIAILLLRN